MHFDAITDIVTTLRLYLGEAGIVLSNQFLYYSQGYPKVRIAPDVMVIFDVPPGPRDNYKLWVEGQIPQAVFEITSPSTQEQDLIFKKTSTNNWE
ncbi:Uma2 family endonuclease [Synechococcus sp. PCC 6312]|uniref:Uma2 family endonuclease n=1 Tax=Synechococcus sp. (strain ATCC 27167 / PCC 6312) TaxID=195253 RepID=UPI0003056EAA